jgi:hypothetical protein
VSDANRLINTALQRGVTEDLRRDYDTARIVHSRHPANAGTETETRVEAVEQGRRADSSRSIQSQSS